MRALSLRFSGTRPATLGHLGHMRELCAMWAWVGACMAASFAALAIGPALGRAAMLRSGRSPTAARLAGGRG